MKNIYLLLLVGACFICNVHAQSDYKLVWSDEFETDGKPDETKWNYEYGFVRNQEQQWYQPQNIHCENGLLKIIGKREKVKNSNYIPDSKDWKENREYASYTSGCIITKDRQSWLYGRFEIKARIPAVKGSWPAIWFLGDKRLNPWPLCGEIDLMEYYRVNDVPTILANTVYGRQVWNTSKTPMSHFLRKDKDWENKFHVWRMDWTEDYIRLYLDDELLNETDITKTINPGGFNPFRSPQCLLINLAIGRQGESPDETPFPIVYEIDYVRVYQKQ